MTAEQKINHLERKVATLEAQIAHITRHFRLEPTREELDDAIEALAARGDVSALNDYLQRGGKLPEGRA
jgi:hypothetical protein